MDRRADSGAHAGAAGAAEPAAAGDPGPGGAAAQLISLRGGGAVGRWRLAQLGAVYAVICAHAAVMAYTDPLPFDPTFITLLLLFSVQLSLLLGILLAFFLLTSNTIDVRLGLFPLYFRRYR
ncbi:hypothetical protein Rsub_09266 [Raphidocelis subcapitata]|nr:hypothetical protein Rsub_09266 [Raphidocelis subcapitata]|eukprot:GBF96467.1 hypothetical protein Rsub_09266 [Raphidocelis subcapitata]